MPEQDYAKNIAIAFAMHCDLAGLTRQQGIELAERVGEATMDVAEDRPEVN